MNWSIPIRLSIPIQFQFKIFQFNSNSIHAELNWIDYQFQFNSWIDPSPAPFKVAEDDIAFKLAILKKSLHLNDNTCFCSIIQSSKLVLGSLLAKNNFFVQFWTKNFASSRMANCGSGLPAEWPFRSQNAIEASDSPLPGGLWVKRLITHALCSLAYSDIAWCKLFLIFTMKCLYWVFFAYKTPNSVLIDNSIHIQEMTLKKLGWHFRAKFLDASNIYQFRN